MRRFFGIAVASLLLASFGVWRSQPGPPSGREVLVLSGDSNPLLQAECKLFNDSSDRYTIQIDPDNHGTQIAIVQSLAGVGPDMIAGGDQFALAAYVKSGVAMDLTDILNNAGIDVKTQCQPGVLGRVIANGRIYGVPSNASVDAIWFHRDIFRQAGVPYPKGPWTWEEMVRLAQRMTVRSKDGHILQYGLIFDWNSPDFFDFFGARLFSQDGARCTIDSPAAIRAVSMMRDLIYKYRVAPTPSEEASMVTEGGFGSGVVSWFGAKRSAMALGGRWWLATLRSYKDLDLGVAEAPTEGQQTYYGYGRPTFVNKGSKHLDGDLAFLKFLAGPAYNHLINAQADGMSAFKQYADDPALLHDTAHPQEHDNDIWVHAMEHSAPDPATQFLDGGTVTRLMKNQMDLVQDNQKSPALALHDLRAEIESAMRDALAEDPSAAAEYRRLTGRDQP